MRSTSTSSTIFDAIVIGGGPSGLGASLALSGWRPHYLPACRLPDSALMLRLQQQLPPDGRIPLAALPALSAGMRGRSNNLLALFFDALQHPGVDQGLQSRSCLELRRSGGDGEVLRHLVLDPEPPGGSWHSMHETTRTLSPGPWMELPGFPLADHIRSATPSLSPAAAAAAAAQRQPRRLVAEYYRARENFTDPQHTSWLRSVRDHITMRSLNFGVELSDPSIDPQRRRPYIYDCHGI